MELKKMDLTYRLLSHQESYGIGDQVRVLRIDDGVVFNEARVKGFSCPLPGRKGKTTIRVQLAMFGDVVIVTPRWK